MHASDSSFETPILTDLSGAPPYRLETHWSELVWFHRIYELRNAGTGFKEISVTFKKKGKDWARELVSRLGDRLGVQLLVGAKPGSFEFSDEAHDLFAQVQTLFEARDAIYSPHDRPVIRIHAIDAAIHFWIPKAIGPVLQKYPDIHVQVVSCEWRDAIQAVLRRTAHFGIGTSWIPSEQVTYIELFERPHGAVVKTGHPLAKAKQITIDDLTRHPLIFLQPHIIPYDITAIVPQFRRQGTLVYLLNCSQILSWVRHGLGIGIMTEDMVSGNQGVKWIPIVPETAIPFARDAIFVHKDGESSIRSEPARELIARLRTFSKEWRKNGDKS